jgi:DNA-binding MarR family transcriptional regulator
MRTESTTPGINDQTVSFYSVETYAPEESIGYFMRRILSTVAQDIERELEHSGLTNAQWLPLFILARDRVKTGAELARECELDAGAMTRLLDRLEAKGLCRRERSLDDRRVVNLEITKEGRQAAKLIPKVLCGVHNAALAGFSVEEWTTLQQLLKRVLHNVQTHQANRQERKA